MELILAQVNSGCAVDRQSQRAAWCLGRLVSALMFTQCEHSCLRVKCLRHSQIMVGHRCTHVDVSTRQVHTLQQQRRNFEHSVFIGQYSNKRTTYHSATELVSRTRPVRAKKHIAYLAGKLFHVMDVCVVFHVQFEVLLANVIDLHP